MKQLSLIIIFLFFIGCKISQKEINKELQILDGSLDSLITIEVYSTKQNLTFQGDTLRNNPKYIIENCYVIVGDDSTKIDANSKIYYFKENRIISSSSKINGKNYVQKFLYFDENIDNELMFDNWSKTNDTIYFARLEKYDSLGRLIKLVRVQNFVNSKKMERVIDIYKYYDDNKFKTWRKELYSDKFNLDTIRKLKTKEFISDNYDWNNFKRGYEYKFDSFGNWTTKKSIKGTNEVYYRTIKY